MGFSLGEELEKIVTCLPGTPAPESPPVNFDEALKAIADLKGLPVFQREIRRDEIAKQFGIRKGIIDEVLKNGQEGADEDSKAIVSDVEPWGTPVDGATLLTSIKDSLLSHVILPAWVAVAVSVWVLLTYCFDAFRILPIAGIESPEKRCGKTTLLEWLMAFCRRALISSNISSAAIFRTVEKYGPTLLVDEADTFLKDNEELRGILNSGHTKSGAFVIRVQGDDHEPVRFSTWTPKAIAMIGRLPETLRDRSIIISLRRKAPGERVQKMGIDFDRKCLNIRRMCLRWADDNFELLKALRPVMPKTNNDRMTDNWFPLMCIAEAVGGEWPELIMEAINSCVKVDDDESIVARLLEDIKTIFVSRSVERIFSDHLVDALKTIPETPWAEWSRGKGLTANGLARLLKPFGIHSKTMRIGSDRAKGYELSIFEDAFNRYLSLTHPIQSVTTCQINKINDLDCNQSVTSYADVTDGNNDNYLKSFTCHGVTDGNGVSGKTTKEEVF